MKLDCLNFLSAVVLCCGAARADTQIWRGTAEDSTWNATSANWNEGSVWTNESAAVFPADAARTVTVTEPVVVSNIDFQVDGYRLAGPGVLSLPTSKGSVYFTVAEGATTVIDVPLTNPVPDSVLAKSGPGTLTLTGRVDVSRIHVSEGTLQLISNEVWTARLRASFSDSDATLHVDGAVIHGYKLSSADAGVLLGDVQKLKKMTLGPGGMTVDNAVDQSMLQDIASAPGVADGGIVKRGQGVLTFSGDSSFAGGLRILSSQVRIRNATALGTGPVYIEAEGSPFFAEGDVTLPNKLFFAREGWVGSTGNEAYNLVLTRIGSMPKNTAHAAYFGRSGGNYSRAGLSLTGPDSEPMSVINLRGRLDFTIDGGVITAREDAQSPFFNTAGMGANPRVAKVGRDGFTFDTNGAGQPLDLGLTLIPTKGCVVTNAQEDAAAFANPGFEGGTAGWTVEKLAGNSDGLGGRYSNTSGFTSNDDYKTTDGSYFFGMRRCMSLTSSFTVPSAGVWRVVCQMGCRDDAGYQSYRIPLAMTVDGTTVYESEARDGNHPFRKLETEFLSLEQGSHTLVVTTGALDGRQYSTLLFDQFRLEQAVETCVPTSPVTKLGAGTLVITNLVTDGAVTVSGGTLRLADSALAGAAVSVADGAAFGLESGTMANAAVTVSAGGTLSLGDARNFVPNGDFEKDDVCQQKDHPEFGYQNVTADAAGWTFRNTSTNSMLCSGVQKNGGTLSTLGSVMTPSGVQTAFLRVQNEMKTTVAVPADGLYRFSFIHAARQYNNGYELSLTVTIDSETVISVEPRTAYYPFRRESRDIALTAGSHELVFFADGAYQSGRMLFIDDIRLNSLAADSLSIVDTRIDLARGATLNLPNPVLLELPGGVYVDGKAFTGSGTRLAAQGVNVTGEGSLVVGPPCGTLLIVR